MKGSNYRIWKHWDLMLLRTILDAVCIYKEAPAWAFVVLGLCVAALLMLRLYWAERKKRK